MQNLDSQLDEAANAIRDAGALLFTAGAGTGVDSGLPDFRGDDGFWKAYPPLRARGLSFQQMANPQWFMRDPQLAWGFYGHRVKLYQQATPHDGFAVLKQWGQAKSAFVFTSNVDGHFQKAGLNDVIECHGSILYAQCSVPCHDGIWALEAAPEIDAETFRATGELPMCPRCGHVARPNILMFYDGQWIERRSEEQYQQFACWLEKAVQSPLAIIKCGAGRAVPTVRNMGEDIVYSMGKNKRTATLIRINVHESNGPRGTISLPLGARDALHQIAARL
jgi:NAD-dependent SIR2 family protein deacetylase